MDYSFSHGVERVIGEATRWQLGSQPGQLQSVEVLLALAQEAECRAAQVLRRHGIEADDIRRRWPELRLSSRPHGPVNVWSHMTSCDMRQAVRSARVRLQELPQPLTLATEHLLLGMLDANGEVSRWLVEKGLSATELEHEIYGMYGQSRGPIDVDLDGESEGIADCGVWSMESAESGECEARSAESPEVAIDPEERNADDLPVGTLRVLDAAANRAREAVRVVEDFSRFALDDRHLTERCKQLRHELARLLAGLPSGALLAARETQSDVGTGLSLPSEQRRAGVDEVVTANGKRLQESLRTLEEYSKTISSALGQGFERLRYQSYTLERAIAITASSLRRLKHARLYVLIDGCASPAEFESLAEGLVAAGVDVLQLRDKQLDDRQLLDRARRLRAMTQSSRTLLIINDRPDLAILCQADGVHVGQEELTVKDARTIVGPRRLVGVSTHSIEQARQAVLDGADYLGVGPTFPSSTKSFADFTGLELLRTVSREIRLPAFAIGGIGVENLPHVLQAGVDRVAVSGAIVKASDPAAAAEAFLDLLKPQGAEG